MDAGMRPFRTTLIFGGICGLVWIPLEWLFGAPGFRPFFFRLAVFGCVAVYALLLARWGNKRRRAVLFPLLLLFLFLFSNGSTGAFLLLALGLLSWIRSGICFEHTMPRALFAELGLSIGGGALVAYFNPHSALAWALGVWLFFLIQALYFVFMEPVSENRSREPMDGFEHARMRAEAILASMLKIKKARPNPGRFYPR
jgi:hypothetical protein